MRSYRKKKRREWASLIKKVYEVVPLVCPDCGGAALSWVIPSGRGTVYSTTIIRRKPEKGGDYNIAVVELAEGPRLMTRIENVAPEQVRIGMEVSARITGSGENALLVFVPAREVGSR